MPKYEKNQYLLGDVYKFYVERTANPVSYKEHKAILDAWGERVVEYLVAGKDVKLHGGLSLIGIRKRDSRSYLDYQASKKAGHAVRKSNSHSGFYAARIYWRRRYTKINSATWNFTASRFLQRKISAVMNTPGGHLRFSKAMTIATDKTAKYIHQTKIVKI